MLREKMSYSVDVTATATRTSSLRASATSGHHHAMDAMGPVLEQVLGNLTQVGDVFSPPTLCDSCAHTNRLVLTTYRSRCWAT
jgi:hypothetical protein